MSLVSMKKVLKDSQAKQYGVLACNLLNYDMLLGGIQAAEEANSPIILQLAPVQFEEAPLAYFGPIMVDLAKKASVPVVVHLDHGSKMSDVKEAIDIGFSSVMIDASQEEFETNVNRTQEVVNYAHKHGVDVEAELGYVGAEGAYTEAVVIAEENLTDIDLAKEFIAKTNCDSLAVAIGNAHGLRVKAPALDFKRLKELNESLSRPLVLHGGSGTSDNDFQRCIQNGITKINIASLIHKEYVDALRENTSNAYATMHQTGVTATKDIVTRFLYLFGSNNQMQ